MAGNKNSGPRRKPTRLKLLEGGRGHRTLNPDAEPKFDIPDDIPAPPERLDADAREIWTLVAPDLHTNGLLLGPGLESFANYCALASRVRYCEAEIKRLAKVDDNTRHGGLVQVTKQGNLIQHPLLGIANTARRDMLRLAIEFGLTPSAAASIQGVSKRDDEDKTEKKFFG